MFNWFGREKERYFTVNVLHGNRSYTVIGDRKTTLETVWASQKCFFLSGTQVRIIDDEGNSKIFTA